MMQRLVHYPYCNAECVEGQHLLDEETPRPHIHLPGMTQNCAACRTGTVLYPLVDVTDHEPGRTE